MTSDQLRIRQWCTAASAMAQLGATASGMVPWWALPLTLALTAAVSRPPRGRADPRRVRLTRGAGVAGVGLFAGLIAFKSIAAGSAGADPVATLRSLTEALVILSLVMAPEARTPREYRVWLTVTTGVLVAAAAGGRSPLAGALALASWIILLTAITKVQIAAAHSDDAVVAVPIGGAPATAGRRTSMLWQSGELATILPVGIALIAGALVYFALPSGLGGPGLAKRIARHVQSQQTESTLTRATIGVDTYGDGDLSLLVRGAPANTPILRVPAASPTLWRGTFYSTYTGSSWVVNDTINPTFARGNNVDVPLSPADPPPVGRTRTYTATFAPGFRGSLVWAPGVPIHLAGAPGQFDGVGRNEANTRIFGTPPAATYRVTAAIATRSPAKLAAATGSDPAGPTWTQLPAELPSQVSDLAHQITATATNRYQQVKDIEHYLRTHETYSLNSPVPTGNEDAVDEFLFRDHTGFCEQFASAEAVMLRTLDVPSRVVSGLAYGTQIGNTRIYTGANAHAWVEVYYPGIGWSPSDPTRGAQLAPTVTQQQSWIDRLLDRFARNLPGGRTALVVIMSALLIGLVLLTRAAWRNRREGSGRAGRGGRRPGPVLAAFLRLTASPRAPAPRAPAETAREYLHRVGMPGQWDAALDTLEQECYGDAPPDSATVEAAVTAFAGPTGPA